MPIKRGELDVPDISFHEFVWGKLLEYGDDVAFVDCSEDDRAITYRQIYESSRKCAAFLQSQGIEKGDRIAICAPNSVEYIFLILGIVGSGAAITPSNPFYKKDEILRQFHMLEPKMAFVSTEGLGLLKDVQKELPCLKALFVIGASDDYCTVDEILQKSDEANLQNVDIEPVQDIALIPHSSGTTGLPKGVVLTHRNCVAALCSEDAPRNPDVTIYMDRPMYHGAGYGSILAYSVTGTKCVFEKQFELHKMLRAVEKHKVSALFCIPPNYIELAKTDDVSMYDISSLKAFIYTGGQLAPNIMQRLMGKYRVAFVPVYAMTEMGSVTAGLIPGIEYTSSGRLKNGVELKIVDHETRDECPLGDDGEILVRAQKVMKEYFQNPEATANAFDSEGWYKTGDIGHIGEDEDLFVIDRIKEVIKYKTLQVSPSELEMVIFRHPNVADVGVVGIPDVQCGEVPKAFVVRGDDSLTEAEIHSFIEENLIEYKHLRGGVEFVAVIPRSTYGKIERSKLKLMAGL